MTSSGGVGEAVRLADFPRFADGRLGLSQGRAIIFVRCGPSYHHTIIYTGRGVDGVAQARVWPGAGPPAQRPSALDESIGPVK